MDRITSILLVMVAMTTISVSFVSAGGGPIYSSFNTPAKNIGNKDCSCKENSVLFLKEERATKLLSTFSFNTMAAKKSVPSLNQGDQDRLISEVVRFILVMDQKKYPIKKTEINKHILKEHSKSFPIIIGEVTKRFSEVFGFQLKELENKHKGSYILINELDCDSVDSHLRWSEIEDSKRGLLMVVLSLIFMQGNEITDCELWSFLSKLGIKLDQPHEVFGDCKKLITQEWVRQCYLEMTTVPNVDPPVSQIRWGQRAFLETSKRKMLSFVSKIYGIEDLSLWTSQWADVQDSEAVNEQSAENSGPSTSSQSR
ncbi:Melanoma-associated antigen G1 [Mactra antiquata]